MKEMSIIVPPERLNDINAILHKHKVGGMYFFGVTGRGRWERPEIEATTYEGYKTGKRYVPEFGSRTLVQVIVPDSVEGMIVSEIFQKISTGSAGDGKIFVKDISKAYDIGTKQEGEQSVL